MKLTLIILLVICTQFVNAASYDLVFTPSIVANNGIYGNATESTNSLWRLFQSRAFEACVVAPNVGAGQTVIGRWPASVVQSGGIGASSEPVTPNANDPAGANSISTGATNGTFKAFIDSIHPVVSGLQYRFELPIRITNSSSVRAVIAMSTNGTTAIQVGTFLSNAIPTTMGSYLRYDTSAGDSTWQLINVNSSGSTVSNSVLPGNTSWVYMQFGYNSAAGGFVLWTNNVAVQTNTGTLPDQYEQLNLGIGIATLTGATNRIQWGSGYGEFNY